MGKLAEMLRKYFETTPKEVLDREWKEMEPLNEIGPDVLEYCKFQEENFGDSCSNQDREK